MNKKNILDKINIGDVMDMNQSNSFKSETVYNNEKEIKSAITDGISGKAISSTLDGVVNKADELGITPAQLKETVEVVTSMKENNNTLDNSYSSDFGKQNGDKLKEALTEGISSNEVKESLSRELDNANDEKSKKHLNFMVNLMSRFKKRELILAKNAQEKGRQKIKE